MNWPTCPNCGRRAPRETVRRDRELEPAELALAIELRHRRSAGEQLRGENLKLAESSVRTRAGRDVGILRWREIKSTPAPYWGYVSSVPGAPFCTLRCAREFADAALLAGFRRKGV